MSDVQLHRSIEKVFYGTEARVVAAYKVHKCAPSTTSTFSSKKKPPKSKGKERIICLTAERRTKRRGFKGSLHVCKVSSGVMQIHKSYLLKYITRVEAFPSDQDTSAFVELHLSNTTFTSETRKAFQIPSALLIEVVGSIYLFCRKHEKKPPAVSGLDIAVLDTWAAQQQGKDSALEGIGAFGAAMLGGGNEGGEGDGEGQTSLVSAKEERDLHTLLEMFAMGVGDVDQFQTRLQDELAALEAANVHAILESGPFVQRVQTRLNDSIALIDDLDETLAIFDLKLRHMREDIAAIESRNNRLELQTRNNGKLMVALEEVLARLDLPEDTQDLLQQTDFDDANLEEVVAGAWQVQEALECLADAADNPKGLDRGLATMSAVAQHRSKLQALIKVFVERACSYLSSQMSHLGDTILAGLSKSHHSASASLPDHRPIRQRLRLLRPLMQVVQAIQPGAMPGLRASYTQSVNVVIRKELRLYVSTLRKAAAANIASNPAEPDMGMAHKRSDMLEGLQHSKLSYSSRSDSESPLHSLPAGNALASPGYGDRGSLAPHSAWEALLNTRLPFLLSENQAATDFLGLLRGARHQLSGKIASSGLIPASPSKHYERSSSQLSSLTRGTPPTSPSSKGISSKDPSVKAGQAPMKSTLQLRATEEDQANELEPEGTHVLSALLEGIQSDFQSMVIAGTYIQASASYDIKLGALPLTGVSTLITDEPYAVDVIGKSNHILAVPMLSLTLRWSAKLKGDPLAAPLTVLLADCCQRLHMHFTQFIMDRVGAIGKFEGKSGVGLPGSDSVKGQHLLPFLPAFSAFVSRLQELLADSSFSSSEPEPPRRLASKRSTRSASADQDSNDGDANHEDEEDDISMMSMTDDEEEEEKSPSSSSRHNATGQGRQSSSLHRPSSQQPASMASQAGADAAVSYDIPLAHDLKDIRELVTPAYGLLARAMFQTVERLAGTDSKHGDRLRLESYAYFVTALSDRADAVPVLHWHVRQAAAAKQRAMQAYVQQQLEHGKFWKLMEFSVHVDQLLREVDAAEVPFQMHYQAADLRALLQSTMHHPEKKVHSMLARVQKHMGTTSPTLVAEVWPKILSSLQSQYERIAEQIKTCYTEVQLPMSPSQLKSVLSSVSASR